MFADISGFTRLSEQLADLGKAGAEELTVLLNGTFEALLGVARDEGGDLVKFGGDALFLFFEGDRHAERACRAAAGMRATLKRRGAMVTDRGRVLLRISMGVHSGPFLFVLAGTSQRELFVLGEHATTVTAMEATADAGEILVSPATAALLPAGWRGDIKGEGVLLRRVSGTPFAPPSAAADHTATGADSLDAALAPYIPAAIRRRLEDQVHDAEHRRTTVSFIHVGGIDQTLRDDGPDTVCSLIHRIVDTVVEAAERFGVTLLATDVAGGGLKLILTAGVPEAAEDGEGRMLSVGRALLDADLGLPIRVGVNTGHVFAGEVGAGWRRVYTVMGDAVNLSARLMAKAEHGQLVASKVTLEQSLTRFDTTELEPFLVKGKRHPQHASVVGNRVEGRGRDAWSEVPFVGRAQELADLEARCRAAVADRGAAVEILGEPGIGKSRLVHELIARMSDVRVVRLTCEPFSGDRPFFMARVLLRTALRIPFDATPDEAGAALLAWLGEHLPDRLPFAPLVGAVIDAEVPATREVQDLGAEYRVLRLREVAADVLLTAFDHPLLLVVEDAMWMDEASSLAIAAALAELPATKWFGCFTTRDDQAGLSHRLGYEAEAVRLSELDSSMAELLAMELTEDAGIPPNELAELCARANGNPLFLVELAQARRELGSLDHISGSLEDLIGARIDHLSPADRNLLRHAAVLGDRFSPRLFERTLGPLMPGPPKWNRLADFIVTDQGEMRFAHDLVRRVAYAGLPFRRRRELHLRIGTALVPRSGEPDDARLGLLALHFDGSGDHSMAWKYNHLAGERARANYATVEATAFFERAIRNARAKEVGVGPGVLADAYEALADVAMLAGRYDLSLEGYRGARRLLAHDVLAVARLCRKEGKLREQLGKHSAAIPWFRRGLSMLDGATGLDAAEVAGERGRLHVAVASTRVWQQRYRQCVAACRTALPHCEAAADMATAAHAYYLMDWALNELGDAEAAACRERARSIYEELGDYQGLAVVLNNQGVDDLVAGRWEAASAALTAARVAYERSGDMITRAQVEHNLSEVYIELGRHEEAEVYLRDARRTWRASGFAMGVAAATNGLGRTLARSGRAEEGAALLRDALERFQSLNHGPFVAESAVRLAEALVFGGKPSEALAVLDEYDDRVADGGPPVLSLAMRMRGTALAMLGEVDAARRQLEATVKAAGDAAIHWEVALAEMEIARLPGVDAEEAAALDARGRGVLVQMGVDVEKVQPPMGALRY